MDQSPYTSPKSVIPPPNRLPKRNWILSILTGLVSAILGPVLLVAWGFGLLYGWNSDGLLMFHLIYAALILGPAIGIFIFAFSGRATPFAADSPPNLADWIGTTGCCIIGVIFLCLYATALSYKLWSDTAAPIGPQLKTLCRAELFPYLLESK